MTEDNCLHIYLHIIFGYIRIRVIIPLFIVEGAFYYRSHCTLLFNTENTHLNVSALVTHYIVYKSQWRRVCIEGVYVCIHKLCQKDQLQTKCIHVTNISDISTNPTLLNSPSSLSSYETKSIIPLLAELHYLLYAIYSSADAHCQQSAVAE